MEQTLLDMLANLSPVLKDVLMWLGVLVCTGQLVVLATPTKRDDALLKKAEGWPFVGGLLKALKAFAPVRKD